MVHTGSGEVLGARDGRVSLGVVAVATAAAVAVTFDGFMFVDIVVSSVAVGVEKSVTAGAACALAVALCADVVGTGFGTWGIACFVNSLNLLATQMDHSPFGTCTIREST